MRDSRIVGYGVSFQRWHQGLLWPALWVQVYAHRLVSTVVGIFVFSAHCETGAD